MLAQGVLNVAMATAFLIIIVILLSSSSRILIRRRFNVKQHLELVERAAARNAKIKTHTT